MPTMRPISGPLGSDKVAAARLPIEVSCGS